MIFHRFQPLISSDGQDEIYNPDSQINTYNDNFTCDYFDLDNEDLGNLVLQRQVDVRYLRSVSNFSVFGY